MFPSSESIIAAAQALTARISQLHESQTPLDQLVGGQKDSSQCLVDHYLRAASSLVSQIAMKYGFFDENRESRKYNDALTHLARLHPGQLDDAFARFVCSRFFAGKALYTNDDVRNSYRAVTAASLEAADFMVSKAFAVHKLTV